MIITVVMNGSWQELPIDIGTDISKLEDRITENNNFTDSYGALYDSICITASEDNKGPVLISDYSEAKQESSGDVVDHIELIACGELHLPWNRKINALNRPMAMGQAGDVLKIVAR